MTEFVVDFPAHPGTLFYRVDAVLDTGERFVGETVKYFHEPGIEYWMEGWDLMASLSVYEAQSGVVLGWNEQAKPVDPDGGWSGRPPIHHAGAQAVCNRSRHIAVPGRVR